MGLSFLSMDHDFSKLFHQTSKNKAPEEGTTPPVPLDEKQWPDDWKTVFYKTYPRFSKIAFREITPPAADFFGLLSKRISRRDFLPTLPAKDKLAVFFHYALGIMDLTTGRRAHPSAGARYPLDAYLVVFEGNQDIPSGVYHYAIKNQALEILWQRSFSLEERVVLSQNEMIKKAPALLVLTATFSRTQNKYGARGYRHLLIEAGHIGQNVYLLAEALGLACTGIGNINEDVLEELLAIDGIKESVVYTLLFGDRAHGTLS